MTCDNGMKRDGGMNEKGFVANLLFLGESEYPSPDGDKRPLISIAHSRVRVSLYLAEILGTAYRLETEGRTSVRNE
ncbi:MAG TPA: hypothetical protein DDZ51_09025 [Planctomycetaceae bacterium]|nr:hypothetical protein [Planctomycetaceae bacterium]